MPPEPMKRLCGASWGSLSFKFWTRDAAGMPYTDEFSGFRVFRRVFEPEVKK